MKRLKVIISYVLCFSIYFATETSFSTYAESAAISKKEDIYELDCMQPYIQILSDINEKYQTDFAIPTEKIIKETSLDKAEMIKYFTSFDVDEFEQHIISKYQASLANENVKNQNADISLCAVIGQKQNINFSNGNSIGFWSNTYYADGLTRYSSISNSCFDYVKTPYYKPTKFTYTLKNQSSQVECIFVCGLYLSEYVLYTTTPRTFTGTFSASGGDLNQVLSM